MYKTQCFLGRQLALADLQLASETDNLPKLTRRIQEMSLDKTGQGAGYLFQLAEVAIYGLKAGIADVAD